MSVQTLATPNGTPHGGIARSQSEGRGSHKPCPAVRTTSPRPVRTACSTPACPAVPRPDRRRPPGADATVRIPYHRHRELPERYRRCDRERARLRARGERAFARLKQGPILQRSPMQHPPHRSDRHRRSHGRQHMAIRRGSVHSPEKREHLSPHCPYPAHSSAQLALNRPLLTFLGGEALPGSALSRWGGRGKLRGMDGQEPGCPRAGTPPVVTRPRTAWKAVPARLRCTVPLRSLLAYDRMRISRDAAEYRHLSFIGTPLSKGGPSRTGESA